jgi:hypothetical protein
MAASTLLFVDIKHLLSLLPPAFSALILAPHKAYDNKKSGNDKQLIKDPVMSRNTFFTV